MKDGCQFEALEYGTVASTKHPSEVFEDEYLTRIA
jgi:hypothetical protein